MIVISHFEFLSKISTFYTEHLHNAGMAVVFFFMLSGFGLTYSDLTRNKEKGLIETWSPLKGYRYAVGRVKKLYLAYILSMAMMIPLTLIAYLKDYDIVSSISRCILRFIFSATLLQSFAGTTKLSHLFNGACWFLSTLAILYAFYPLLKRVNRKYFVESHFNALFALFIAFVLRFIVLLAFYKIDNISAFFNDLSYGSPYLRIFDFVMGILLCDIYLAKSRAWGNGACVSNAFEIFSVGIVLCWWLLRNSFVLNSTEFDFVLKGSFDVLIVAVTLFVFSADGGIVSRFLSTSTMQTLGKSAMFVYLFHYPIRINVGKIIEMISLPVYQIMLINIVVIVAFTFILTYAFVKVKRYDG